VACYERSIVVQKSSRTMSLLLVLSENRWLSLKDWVALRAVSIDWNVTVESCCNILKRARGAEKQTLLEQRAINALLPDLKGHPDWWVTLKTTGACRPRHCNLLGCACTSMMPIHNAIHVILNLAHNQRLYRAALASLDANTELLSPFLPILCYAPLRCPPFYRDFLEPLGRRNGDLCHRLAFTAKALGNEPLFHKFATLEPSVGQALEFGDLLLKVCKSATLEGRKKIIVERDKKRTGEWMIPGQPTYTIVEIRWAELKTINSSTRPVICPIVCRHRETGRLHLISVLVKFEPVISDYLVMHFLAWMQQLRKDWPILSYHVQPLTPDAGIIIIVNQASTLFQIKESGQSIQNHLLNKNPYVGSRVLRMRFVRSCAVSSVLQYVCGLGDRHTANILLTDAGELFHIDFGFLFEKEVVLRKIVKQFTMKLTPEILDMLGGRNGECFDTFVNDTTELFEDVRKNWRLFYYIFCPMFLTRYCNFTKDEFLEFIEKTLVPNQTEMEAKIKVENIIQKNTQNTNFEVILDTIHFLKKTWLD
jgi:hypothetical protein